VSLEFCVENISEAIKHMPKGIYDLSAFSFQFFFCIEQVILLFPAILFSVKITLYHVYHILSLMVNC
jgi:hypothetical protein